MNSPNIDLILMPTFNCNMRCDYCYVIDKTQEIIDINLVKKIIQQIVSHNNPTVPTNIFWHGAEPLLAGIPFYKHIFEWSRRTFGQDSVKHHIQTNGILLNNDWFDLFIQEHVTTGVSLDGPEFLHNAHRKLINGKGSFKPVFNNIMAARGKKLFFDVLCVITRETLEHVDELFDFFYENQIDFGFEPIIPVNESMKKELALTPEEYSSISIRLFDRWFFQNERKLRMVVPPYHYAKSIIQGVPSYCNFSPNCARNHLAVSPDGTVHSCIMFAHDPELSFGNFNNLRLNEILESPNRKKFLLNRFEKIQKCKKCKWNYLCHSGCPYHAQILKGHMMHPDCFCESYQKIFTHVYDILIQNLND